MLRAAHTMGRCKVVAIRAASTGRAVPLPVAAAHCRARRFAASIAEQQPNELLERLQQRDDAVQQRDDAECERFMPRYRALTVRRERAFNFSTGEWRWFRRTVAHFGP